MLNCVFSSKRAERKGSTGFSAAEFETGVSSICKALSGTYRDLDGKRKQVQGDITKVKYAISDEAGLRLLKNLEHTGMQIPGTVEIRKIIEICYERRQSAKRCAHLYHLVTGREA